MSNKPMFTPLEDQLILAEYAGGDTAAAIGQRWGGTSRGAVKNAIIRAGGVMRERGGGLRPSRRVFTPDEDRVIAARYFDDGETPSAMADDLGVFPTAIKNAVRRARGRLRTISEAKRQFHLDEHFFDLIDAEAKAYWLGFLAADGSVSSRINTVKLTLAITDIDHLEKYRRALRYEAPVRDEGIRVNRANGKLHSSHAASVVVRSKPIRDALIRNGVGPRKSLTLTPWEGPPELIRHYWRGVFDGDGSIGCYTARSKWVMTLVGSAAMIDGFASYVHANTTYRPRIDGPGGAHGRALQARLDGVIVCQQMTHLLYDGASVFLDRKQALAAALWERPVTAWALERWGRSPRRVVA